MFEFSGGGVQVCLSATKLVFETSWIDKFVRDRPDVAPAKFGTRLPVTSATISTIFILDERLKGSANTRSYLYIVNQDSSCPFLRNKKKKKEFTVS